MIAKEIDQDMWQTIRKRFQPSGRIKFEDPEGGLIPAQSWILIDGVHTMCYKAGELMGEPFYRFYFIDEAALERMQALFDEMNRDYEEDQ